MDRGHAGDDGRLTVGTVNSAKSPITPIVNIFIVPAWMEPTPECHGARPQLSTPSVALPSWRSLEALASVLPKEYSKP
jgi:hypothetical protein